MATGKPSSFPVSTSTEESPDPVVELIARRRDEAAAAQVQQSMLPSSPVHIGSYRIDFKLKGAAELTGDHVAIAQWPNGDFAFVISDVAGHGTAAALVTVLIQSFMNRLASSALTEPVAILGALNDELLALGVSRHMCCVCGVVNSVHALKLAGAGAYPRPLLLRGASEAESVVVVDLVGKALGLFSDPECVQSEFAMHPSDRLTVITDGVLELMSEASSDEKEVALMRAAKESGADAFFGSLGLPPDVTGPDDITWFSVERLA